MAKKARVFLIIKLGRKFLAGDKRSSLLAWSVSGKKRKLKTGTRYNKASVLKY
jgi:hypothetical protein